MASRTLYPVSINSTQPAFIKKDEKTEETQTICALTFSLSSFNREGLINVDKDGNVRELINVDEHGIIKNLWAHATVLPANGGLSVVNDLDITNSGIPTEDNPKISQGYTASQVILDLPIKYNPELDLCTIEISSAYLKEGHFAIDQAYKFQVRLAQTSYVSVEGAVTQEQFISLDSYASTFSEWSTVTLAVCIGKPDISTILNLESYSSNLFIFVGNFSCSSHSREGLARYKFILSKNSDIIEETQWIENRTSLDTNFSNFTYTFKHLLETGNYKLEVQYETVNKYQDKKEFEIMAQPQTDNNFTLITNLNVNYDEEEGQFTFKLNYDGENNYKTYDIYRLDVDFGKEWEKIGTITDLTKNYADCFLQSGRFYQYGINVWTVAGNNIFVKFDELIIRRFNYSYLLGENGQQLKLLFNNDMNSYKTNVADQLLTTIGNPYPYINRVSEIYYRTIPINGLISMQMDENQLFLTTNEYCSAALKEYNDTHGISIHQDYISERNFREQVMKFLLNGKPKLFKSPTEGNILLRLMDVNFTPNQQLSRMIYSFTSTGQEISEASLEKMQKYNIKLLNSVTIETNNNHTTHI